MQKGEFLYEGKAKRVYRTEDPTCYIVEYKDTATAFDGLKKEDLANKGVLNNNIAALFFAMLQNEGIPTHFVKKLSEREMLVRALQIIPVEVIVRNIVAGSLAKRLGLPEGAPLKSTVLEFNLKNDALHDPMLNQYHIQALELATARELARMEELALRVNELLRGFLEKRDIILVDFKLEFGRFGGEILLGDEISPDTCRFWDAGSGEKLDKDRFRRDLGGVTDAYAEVLRRLLEVK
ncbi:MAG: phosphoribosylaminoimidazolesuccinocarboxamide synthase [Bacillota bacterium]